MFGNFTIGLLVAASASVWVYSKMMNKTGQNSQQAITTAIIAGLGALIFTVSVLSFIPK